MRTKTVFIVCLTLMVSLALMSCTSTQNIDAPKVIAEDVTVISAESASDSTIKETPVIQEGENKSNWLNALGQINGLNVKSYRIRGEGPDGATFDWLEVTSSKVALSDIRRGKWTIYGEAVGDTGDVVAAGKLETFLSDSTPLGALFLDSTQGQGDARCAFVWSKEQVLYPSVEIFVKYGNGEWISRDVNEIAIGDGSAVWTANNLPAGPYTVRAVLKDEGEVVSGIAAAMRVLDTKTSVGNMRFTVGKLSTVYGIALENVPQDTIYGDLVLEESMLKYVSNDEAIMCDWFINGELVTEAKGNTIDILSLGLKKGYYRIDVVVQGTDPNSINSESCFVFIDVQKLEIVDEETASNNNKGEVPEGYDEYLTHQVTEEKPVIEEVIEAQHLTPAQRIDTVAPEKIKEPIIVTVLPTNPEVEEKKDVASDAPTEGAEDKVIIKISMPEDNKGESPISRDSRENAFKNYANALNNLTANSNAR